jgi:hypothetical protein
MIKPLDPTKTADGLQYDTSDDMHFYQGTGQSVMATGPSGPRAAALNPAPTTGPVASSLTMTANVMPHTEQTTDSWLDTPSTVYNTPNLADVQGPSAADLAAVKDINSDIVNRKMLLEEAKFQLASQRTKHAIYMDIRKEDFREQQLREEGLTNRSKQHEHWMEAYWRPAMGWLYMLICAFDFVIGPTLTMAMPLYLKMLGAASVSYTQWQSITLTNGGLIHLAFGAILGITAWTRGKERLAKMG